MIACKACGDRTTYRTRRLIRRDWYCEECFHELTTGRVQFTPGELHKEKHERLTPRQRAKLHLLNET